MPLFKKALIALAIVIAAMLITAAAAYKLIDDKTIEENALKALQDTLQRDVSVDGNFTLSRSLHPTLQTSGIRIASADWDQGSYLLKAEKIEFGIALLDLLRGIISIENIVFDDAVINIKRNKQGASNLEFSPSKQQAEKNSSPTARFDVIDIQIKNLKINYIDEQTEKSFVYALDSFNLHPHNKETIQILAVSRFDDQPIALSSKMCRIRHLLKGEDCTLSAKIDAAPFSGNIKGGLNLVNSHLNLNVDIQAGDISEFLLTKHLPLPATDNIKATALASGPFNAIKISNLNTDLVLKDTQIKTTGSIDSVNTVSGVKLSIEASGSHPEWLNQYQDAFPASLVNQFSIRTHVENDGDIWKIHSIDSTMELEDSKITSTGEVIVAKNTPQIAVDINAEGKHPSWLNELQQTIAAEQIDAFSIQATIKNPENIVVIENLASKITIKDAVTSAQGTIKLLDGNNPFIDLTVQSTGKNIQSFEKAIKQSLPVSKNFSLASSLKYQDSKLNLSDLKLTLDDTTLAGSSDIEFTSPPNVRANLNADSLNVDHILATLQSDEKENSNQTKNEKTKFFSEKPIDLNWLKSANTDIAISINDLIYKQANLKDITASAIAKNNKAILDIESLTYQDANLRANAKIDADKNIFSHSLHTEDFNLGKLLSEIDASKTLQGKIDASIDVNSHGTTSQQVANNASGKITAIMTEGSLADAPIDLLASNLLVELMPGKSKTDNTKIECLFVQFSGTEGVFESEATLLNTENIVMTTNGSVDLGKEKLNLLLIPKPKNIELFTLDANIRVSGDISDPGFSLDKGSVFKKLLKSAATIAIGPAALAIPFASMGNNKSEKCFSEVASATTKAVEAQQEIERIAKEKAEAEAAEKAKEEALKEAVVETLDP